MSGLTQASLPTNPSPEQRIAQLDTRLGVGAGATKERARLLAQIEQRKTNQTEDFLALAGIFFYLKFMRRRSLSPNYVQSPVIIEADLSALQLGQLGIDLSMERNHDIEGQAGQAIAALLVDFPYRFELLGYLSDTQIRFLCDKLDSLFEQQEFCAQCESWSHYDDTTPFQFAIYHATWWLWTLYCESPQSPRDLFRSRVRIPNHPGSYADWQLPIMVEQVLSERITSLRHSLPSTIKAGT